MVNVKVIQVRKDQEYYPMVLGLHILRLYKQGYRKFEIVANDDKVVVIKTWRIRREGKQ